MRLVLLIVAVLLAAGCGEEPRKPVDPLANDPALVAALNDEIMIDPDLVAQNDGYAAMVVTQPLAGELPPDMRKPVEKVAR